MHKMQGANKISVIVKVSDVGKALTFYLSNEHYMLATEFLLQLTNQPHLDLLERFQLRNWHKDNDCFSTPTYFNFLQERD